MMNGHFLWLCVGFADHIQPGERANLLLRGKSSIDSEFFQEAPDVGEVLFQDPKNFIIVDVPVDVNKSVSKANHLNQRFSKFVPECLMFQHHLDRVGIILRRPKSIFCYDVVAKIYNPLDGHNEVIFGASNLMGVSKKCGFVEVPELFQPRKAQRDFRSNLSYFVIIILQSGRPPLDTFCGRGRNQSSI